MAWQTSCRRAKSAPAARPTAARRQLLNLHHPPPPLSASLPHPQGLYKVAGLKGQPVCFIFTDAEVKDEGFLEYINQLLMTGGWCAS